MSYGGMEGQGGEGEERHHAQAQGLHRSLVTCPRDECCGYARVIPIMPAIPFKTNTIYPRISPPAERRPSLALAHQTKAVTGHGTPWHVIAFHFMSRFVEGRERQALGR